MILVAAQGSSSTLYIVISILGGLVGLYLAFGTAIGRRFVSRLYKGQSIEQIAAVNADQMTAMQAAYTVVKDMRDQLQQENDLLHQRLSALQSIVTGHDEIAAMAIALDTHREALMKRLDHVDTELTQISLAIVTKGGV